MVETLTGGVKLLVLKKYELERRDMSKFLAFRVSLFPQKEKL